MLIFIEYPKCTTCKRAKAWLDEAGIEYTDRNIKDENPTIDEL
ncbi:MAG: arsenate reductase family protein, partial [Ruminococcus sp.]|nr:arsenate reductase family protein [Ruminococcus sp.]